MEKYKILNALTLEERISFYEKEPAIRENLKLFNLTPKEDKNISELIDNETQAAFFEEQYFNTQRITLGDFKKIFSDNFLKDLLKEVPHKLPKWYFLLEELYSNYKFDGILFSQLYSSQVKLSGFFDPFEPIIRYGREKLKRLVEKETENFATLNWNYKIIEKQLLYDIAFTIFDMIDRTLVLELNISKIQGNLKGDSSEERFNDFICQIGSSLPRMKGLIEDYPILFKQILRFIENWVIASRNLVVRLNSDITELKSMFNIQDVSSIKKLHLNAGDKHKGGETVVIITFSSDEKIVYKPRSLSIDVSFQKLLHWVNENGFSPELKTIQIIDKEDYGWVEFVDYLPCKNKQEITTFYERIGGIIALLYSINATDFHFENLIANGEHPVLIDLESLFHSLPSFGYDEVDIAVSKKINQSVIKIQLLPFKMFMYNGVVDISGVANIDGKEAPRPVATWQAQATDNMKVEKVKTVFTESKNSPFMLGDEKHIDILNFSSVIEEGFIKCYNIILQNKNYLLSENSILNIFSNTEVRVLLRATMTYGQFIKASFHPDYLQKSIERKKLFGVLWDITKNDNKYASIVPLEYNSLANMDVPYFFTKPSSLDMFSSGKQVIKNYFDKTGIEEVKNKIQLMSDKDREQQCWFIKASLASSASNHSNAKNSDKYMSRFEPSQTEVTEKELIETSTLLGDKIFNYSLRENGYCNWASLILVDGENYDVRPLMLDLYSGLPGLLVFFSALYYETKDEKYQEITNGCFKNIKRLTDRYIKLNFSEKMGAYDGWAGIIYSLNLSNHYLNREDFKQCQDNALDFLVFKLKEVEKYDIIEGMSGVALVLKGVYEKYPSTKLYDAIQYLGDNIVASAINMDKGKAWINSPNSKPLTGFGHGASGIAFALMEINKILKKPVYRQTAIEAIDYENSLYDSENSNWKDLRTHTNESENSHSKLEMVAWCHGTTGIGLNRLEMLRDDKCNQIFEKDLEMALNSVIKKGFGHNNSLCHGDFGNIELLLQASLFYDKKELTLLVNKISKTLVDFLNTNDCIGGIALGVENPGLMIGTSGVAYQLLRLYNPEIYPSILTLSMPKK